MRRGIVLAGGNLPHVHPDDGCSASVEVVAPFSRVALSSLFAFILRAGIVHPMMLRCRHLDGRRGL
jgi:hypothetical protein